MKLIRRNFLAIVLGAMTSVFGQGAVAAAGPTIKCTRVGQKIIFGGYRYSCIKSKGKLIWKRGAKVAAPTDSTSAKPTASAKASIPTLTFVAKVSEVGEGQTKIVVVKPAQGASFSVAVTRTGASVVVVSAKCTHRGCIVEATASELQCPCHGSAFSPDTGAVNNGPAVLPLRKYVSSQDAGSIYIKL